MYCYVNSPRVSLCQFPSCVKESSKVPPKRVKVIMASQQDREELDAKARQGETVVPGGTGGKSLEAQEHLAEGTIPPLSTLLYSMRA